MTTVAGPASRLLIRETIVSALINGAISAGFFLAMFGFSGPVVIWGVGNFVFDFAPQGFAVAFFAAFVPSLILAKAMRSGVAGGSAKSIIPTGRILLRAVAAGIFAMVVSLALWAGVLTLTGLDVLPAVPAFAMKVAYGLFLGGTVTFLVLRNQIADA